MSGGISNGQIAQRLVMVVAFMGAMSYASVPFYNWFCKVTGWGGQTSVATSGSDLILDRMITVRFDASLARDMPWEFKPLQREMQLKIGETGLAFYEAYNPTDKPMAGTASYNVAPFSAGSYFDKIACFCFEMQVLQPHERVQMPVSFFVDPEIVNDPETKNIQELTLSYTFHVAELPQDEVSLVETKSNPLN
ncbi:MAG: cytochrome c oxidase assembly protein [Rhodobacterales bacterium]|jgi:cytochrome c oxidase assembly protein subunit 11|nr:cytochrome c oxidase assembly protein [Rhodobacter sp.]HBN31947.1 cytochrome c oxidase assembly protein [Paracoccaceae bacterium]